MYITLQDMHEYTPEFLNYLKKRMYILGLSYLNSNRNKLQRIDEYLRETVYKGERKSVAYQIILQGLKNFTIKKASSKVIISINDSIKTQYSDVYTLSGLCQLIDQGNLELNPFPIFTYIFEYVREKITQIYVEYTFGVPV